MPAPHDETTPLPRVPAPSLQPEPAGMPSAAPSWVTPGSQGGGSTATPAPGAAPVAPGAVDASAPTAAPAPALEPPVWSGKKTAIAAALAIGFSSIGAVAAASMLPEGGAQSGTGRGGQFQGGPPGGGQFPGQPGQLGQQGQQGHQGAPGQLGQQGHQVAPGQLGQQGRPPRGSDGDGDLPGAPLGGAPSGTAGTGVAPGART